MVWNVGRYRLELCGGPVHVPHFYPSFTVLNSGEVQRYMACEARHETKMLRSNIQIRLLIIPRAKIQPREESLASRYSLYNIHQQFSPRMFT